MNSQTTNNSNNTSKQTRKKSQKVIPLLQKLRSQVQSFDIVDIKGRLIGKVEDLMVDGNRQLNFVIAKISQTNEINNFWLLNGKLVDKIEPKIRRVFTHINESQLTQLPEYVEKENQVSNMTDNLNSQQPIDNKPDSEINDLTKSEFTEEMEEDIIRLLGERLVVERKKNKIGEVIIRKQVETRMIQIPVRREKLIIEKPGIEPQQLAEIDLGEEEISHDELTNSGVNLVDSDFESGLTVTGEFDSPKIASLILNAIQLEKNHGCKKVRVSILVEDEEKQQKYQEWFDRTSKS
ncbi:MAG: DUF2382 domain-containing protein [Richelia sp. RM2_1_2]|nr:DUF2382 domain-containing protein [Richelia sp. RM1_1_1]NJO57072.1 DUF2382 domain-containing protein [Richelia sp. RM2_1_2]